MTAFTQHGFERAKERLGSNERMIERFIQNAELRGKKPEDFHTRRERDWLRAHGGCGCTAIIYNEDLFHQVINILWNAIQGLG